VTCNPQSAWTAGAIAFCCDNAAPSLNSQAKHPGRHASDHIHSKKWQCLIWVWCWPDGAGAGLVWAWKIPVPRPGRLPMAWSLPGRGLVLEWEFPAPPSSETESWSLHNSRKGRGRQNRAPGQAIPDWHRDRRYPHWHTCRQFTEGRIGRKATHKCRQINCIAVSTSMC